jgi:hypothetical protein
MSNQLDAILAQYEATQSSHTTSSKKFDLNDYFTTYLKPGIKSATRVIRILPALKEGETPFVEMHTHSFQVADGSWKNYTCLKHEENKPCPFCDVRSELLSSGTEDDKEQAKKYRARKNYVARIIDRDDEAHGVKFWRFKDNYQKQGTLDKIINVMQLVKGNVADPTAEAGQDLQIAIARNSNNTPIVQTILPLPVKSKLSEDAALEAEWLGDTRTWRDVYAVKPYEYLEIVIKGGTPTFDKVNEKWVDKDTFEATNAGSSTNTASNSLDGELEMGSSNAGLVAEEKAPVTVTPELVEKTTAPVATETTQEPVAATASATTAEKEDDMPF